MNRIFSDADLNRLSQEVDRQLSQLQNELPEQCVKGGGDTQEAYLVRLPQGDVIVQITREPPKSFLQKFGKAAKADLCDEGGMLHQQWQKWGDLENKEALERLGAVLVAMGFSGGALNSLVVAVLVIVVHIGIKAFCEEYSSQS